MWADGYVPSMPDAPLGGVVWISVSPVRVGAMARWSIPRNVPCYLALASMLMSSDTAQPQPYMSGKLCIAGKVRYSADLDSGPLDGLVSILTSEMTSRRASTAHDQ